MEAEVTVFIHHKTDKAYLVSDTGDREDAVWIPKSQILSETKEKDDVIELILPEWLAKDKGLI